ncbi:hypothetical protein GCM10007108_03400 [Thermogymnomonas acidicola]|uniref:Dihydrodipicolinate synthase family protein n=1 Tax=Thermogymnomonas acidicola TaxID=399579 RepID=A0AA37BQ86_9ARCH|nr:dihydrodipicolinate synthase family protein [Thermogymnomonas acidicola]GGM68631.1 hypothetical protein GCM10007108_03400 [Thermogymnomonas acidicola]
MDRVIPAIPTLFSEDGEVACDCYGGIFSWLRENGVGNAAIHMIGGEYYKLADHERVLTARHIARTFGTSFSIYVNVSASSYNSSLRIMGALAGYKVSGYVVNSPVQSPLRSEEERVYDISMKIIERSGAPFILQVYGSVPQGSTLEGMLRTGRICALKVEASLGEERRIADLLSSRVPLLSGRFGSSFIEELAMGFHGCMPDPLSAPFLMRALDLHLSGRDRDAREVLSVLSVYHSLLLQHFDSFPYLVREAMAGAGIIERAGFREPTVVPDRATVERARSEGYRLVKAADSLTRS